MHGRRIALRDARVGGAQPRCASHRGRRWLRDFDPPVCRTTPLGVAVRPDGVRETGNRSACGCGLGPSRLARPCSSCLLRRARRHRPSGLRVRLLARHARRGRSGLGSDGAALPAGRALGLLLGTGLRRHAGGARNRASRGSLRYEHRGHPGRPARLHGRRGRPRLANRETDRGRTGGTDRRRVLLGLAPLSRVEVRSGARLLRLRPRLRLSHPPARPPSCREAKPARRGAPRPRARASGGGRPRRCSPSRSPRSRGSSGSSGRSGATPGSCCRSPCSARSPG